MKISIIIIKISFFCFSGVEFMVENSAKDHHELFYYDDPQPTSESLNETPFDSSRFELVQSSDPATNFETNVVGMSIETLFDM